MPVIRVRLAAPMYYDEEVRAIKDVLASGNVTQGDRVREMEKRFLRVLEAPATQASVMVNSGSSANLLAAALWQHIAKTKGDTRREVIMPALTWSTTPAPFIQHGFKPVFVDVGPDYCMDAKAVRDAITPETFGIVAVHLLGNPCDMSELELLKELHGLHLFEDCCEALGAKWQGKQVGTWGGSSSFSFYLSHHITTIEGGMFVYPKRWHEVLAFREHGWIRQYPKEVQDFLGRQHPDLHPTWTFDQLGYNVRSDEIHAAMGLVQLKRMEAWQTHRIKMATWFKARLQHPSIETLPDVPGAEPSPFSFPINVATDAYTRKDLIDYLHSHGVETRPVMTGNITKHPWYYRNKDAYRVHGSLANTDRIHANSFLIPCGPHVSMEDAEYVAATFDAFLKEKTGQGLT